MKSYKVSAAELKNFTKTVFEKTGLQESDAQAIAELLVHADVRGVSSHGVIRMKPYIEKINGGGASLKSTYPVVQETANTAVIDAEGGLGAVAGEKAVKIAREKGEEQPDLYCVRKEQQPFRHGRPLGYEAGRGGLYRFCLLQYGPLHGTSRSDDSVYRQ